MEPRLGWEVRPLIESIAPSTASGTGRDGRKDARRGDAAGVVGVEMHWQAGLVLERLDQVVGGARLTQSGHVLDAQHVSPGALQLARQAEIVLERVFALLRVAEIAGVADGRLAQLAGREHRIDGDAPCSRPS